MRTGKIKYAKLSNSLRLQRLHALLLTGKEYTTIEIILQAGIAAVSAAITELRENGIGIKCRLISQDTTTNSRTYGYRLKEIVTP